MQHSMTFGQRFIKRSFDVVVSFFGIVILVLPFLAITLVVKLTSPGPVLFRQKRVGRNGKFFTVVKLRTMDSKSENLGSITTALDARITPVGRIFRKYKIDELPQLWNVFIGKMSFVGPRPDVPGYADRLQGRERGILEIRPGITGPASLYFRNEEELLAAETNPRQYNDTVVWPKKVALNLEYIEKWNFWSDIGYIVITVLPTMDRVFKLMQKEKQDPRKSAMRLE
jgi:lipopolysaccharide/colanic/teichoic acid biosynthesis glycosyltransferase